MFPVKGLTRETKMPSYIEMTRTMERLMNDCSEAGGVSIPPPIDLSMVIPCLVKKVDDYANTIAYPKQVAHMGNSLRTAFAFSKSSILHCPPFSWEKSVGVSIALFKCLQIK